MYYTLFLYIYIEHIYSSSILTYSFDVLVFKWNISILCYFILPLLVREEWCSLLLHYVYLTALVTFKMRILNEWWRHKLLKYNTLLEIKLMVSKLSGLLQKQWALSRWLWVVNSSTWWSCSHDFISVNFPMIKYLTKIKNW